MEFCLNLYYLLIIPLYFLLNICYFSYFLRSWNHVPQVYSPCFLWIQSSASSRYSSVVSIHKVTEGSRRQNGPPQITLNLTPKKPWGSLRFLDMYQFSSVQSLRHVQLFETPWTTAHQASVSMTNSQSPHKLMSIDSVMPSNHLILCHPLLLLPSIFPSIRVFSNESALCITWAKNWSFSAASVLPMNTQDWSSLGWTGWISLQSKGLSRVLPNTKVQKHQFFGAQPSL